MNITTGYGSWVNHGDRDNVSVEASIADAVSGGPRDWLERMEESGAFDRIAADYRTAIDEALPRGISISGNEFIGLHQTDPDYTDAIGDFDIAHAICGIDLQEIIERHDVDATPGNKQRHMRDSAMTALYRALAAAGLNPLTSVDHVVTPGWTVVYRTDATTPAVWDAYTDRQAPAPGRYREQVSERLMTTDEVVSMLAPADDATPLGEMGTDDLLEVLRAHVGELPEGSTFAAAWNLMDRILTDGGIECLPAPWDGYGDHAPEGADDETRANLNARFLPQDPHDENTRPAVEIGTAHVYTYRDAGKLIVSVETVEDDTMPVEFSVNGKTVHEG
ncbi:hypothetical protein [Streptomyces sp. MH60]|uniref:hypothetical protein n=1 Tax=Streptomyces sp. MH60 TaxID=1940758 RepID=UPI000CEEA19A|nr:hypothetical protein [Streptomyces sp. MH60]PPS89594.1 hypothetical protein BZZ08_01741 [Streptomyces sp. MH60]